MTQPTQTDPPWGMRRRFLSVLNGESPSRLPFITRLETWYTSHSRSDTLPERFAGMTLDQVHREIGVGRLRFMVPYALRLCNVEVISHFEGHEFYHEWSPEIENLPGMWDFISNRKAGTTITELKTPVGSLHLRHAMLAEGIFNATEPYLQEHLIKSEADLGPVEYIIEHCEFVPRFSAIAAAQEEIGDHGVVVPLLHRIPFQQLLLEYFGEMNLFYMLHDHPEWIERLHSLLDAQMEWIIARLADFDWPYVEFPDNLHGMMTNPRLFRHYCLPAFQKYTNLLHAQGKKVGSHTDGDIKPLLGMLKESGIDVCESISPYPLTGCTIDEIWRAWQTGGESDRKGPLIWGAIPSPVLEETTTEAEFNRYIEHLFELVGGDPIILGVADLFLRHNSIERVATISERVEAGRA